MANNKISPLAALNRSEGDKRGVSSLKGYGQRSTIGEFLGGFTGAPRRFSVMDPEAAGMQTARDIGEQASVAGQMFGAMTPFAASAAAAKAGQMMGVSPLTVYHGSPHRFSKFDASKIGTGEGAQAFGHGLYFAEALGTGKGYQSRLSGSNYLDAVTGKPVTSGSAWQQAVEAVQNAGVAHPDRAGQIASQIQDWVDKGRVSRSFLLRHQVPKNLEPAYEAAINSFQNLRKNKGSLYTVDLPDEKIAKMLDWDKPLSQQTPEVRKSLQDAGIVGADDWLISGMRGKEIYKRASFGAPVKLPLNQKDDQIYASERLRQAGIPGIRYLDQGSRGVGKGTSNFVVFPGEEEALTILDVKKKGGAVKSSLDMTGMNLFDILRTV